MYIIFQVELVSQTESKQGNNDTILIVVIVRFLDVKGVDGFFICKR